MISGTEVGGIFASRLNRSKTINFIIGLMMVQIFAIKYISDYSEKRSIPRRSPHPTYSLTLALRVVFFQGTHQSTIKLLSFVIINRLKLRKYMKREKCS